MKGHRSVKVKSVFSFCSLAVVLLSLYRLVAWSLFTDLPLVATGPPLDLPVHRSPIPSVNSTSQHAIYSETLAHGVIARAFQPWPKDLPLPCDDRMEDAWGRWIRTPSSTGFLFMKPMKTGGSTAAGINIRMAQHTAQRQQKPFALCKSRWDHAWGYEMLPARIREKSFLWTVLRDPTQRVVSQFFHFAVSRDGVEPTDVNFRRYLAGDPKLSHYYLQTLSSRKLTTYVTDERAPALINQLLDDYDFIGITERMEETAVALKMLLNLPLADVLFLSAKGSGGYDDGSHNQTCFYIQPSFVSPGMNEYFESLLWRASVKWDTILFEAANRSLDLTIERLGRTEFEATWPGFVKRNELLRRNACQGKCFLVRQQA